MKHPLLPSSLSLVPTVSILLAAGISAQDCGSFEELDAADSNAMQAQSMAWNSQGRLLEARLGTGSSLGAWNMSASPAIEDPHGFATVDAQSAVAFGDEIWAVSYDVGTNGKVLVGSWDSGAFGGGTNFVIQDTFDSLVADEYGASLAASGDWLAVGAPDYDNDRGWVYMYRYEPVGAFGFLELVYHSKVEAFNGLAGDRFGESVAIHSGASREVLVAGAPHTNHGGQEEGTAYVYVFNPVTDTWEFNAWWWLSSANAEFGAGVAVHGDYALVGAPMADIAAVDGGYVAVLEWNGSFYDWSGTTFWGGKDGNHVGASLAMGSTYAVIGKPGQDGPDGTKVDMGGASILQLIGGNWSLIENDFYATDGEAGDRFGATVTSGGAFGERVAVGSPGSGKPIRVYDVSDPNTFAHTAAQIPYFGAFGLNQVALDASSVEPKMGGSWQPSLDHSAMTTTPIIAFLGLTTGSADLPLGPGFELLIDIGGPVFTFISPDAVNFTIPMPTDCLHAGLTFYAQAGGVDAFGALELVDPGYQLVMGY